MLFANNASRHNFEVRLYENWIATNKRFDVIFGSIATTGFNHPYVSGVKGASGFFTQDFCNVLPTQNVSRAYTIPVCAPAPVLLAPFRVRRMAAPATSILLCL